MKFIISSKYGEISKIHPTPHSGIDLVMPEGTTLRSISNGTVSKVFDYGNENAGRGVIVQTGDDQYHIFGHMNKVTVKEGQHVNYGDPIGFSGNTGHSTGPHLHFGVKEGGEFIDPSPLVEKIQSVAGSTTYFDVLIDSLTDIFGS